MHGLIVLSALVAVACGAAVPPVEHTLKYATQPRVEGRHAQFVIIPILRQSQDVGLDGSYSWGYETENGISAQEQAVSTPIGPEEADKSVQGEYKYTSPEGEVVFAKYIADRLGFRIIEASHVPAEVIRSSQLSAAHPEADTHYEKKQYRQQVVYKV